MSITAISEPEKVNSKKPFHRRNDSGELDVFEAARYFSGATEVPSYNNNISAAFKQKIMGEDRRRVSLDLPLIRNPLPLQTHLMKEKKQTKEKKHKQPSSPGGRLARFLNSLFNQTSSKKKKSKSTTTESIKDHEEESHIGWSRKRRSSISHFRSSFTAAAVDSNSIYAPGTRKTYKDLRSFLDHKQVLSMSLPTALQNDARGSKGRTDKASLDEKFKFNNNGFLEKNRIWSDKYHPKEEEEFRKFGEVDDGADSDSSSDLFELEINYDYCPCNLPLYGTTHVHTIKRGVPISNGAS